jgi:hypothetical protein
VSVMKTMTDKNLEKNQKSVRHSCDDGQNQEKFRKSVRYTRDDGLKLSWKRLKPLPLLNRNNKWRIVLLVQEFIL